MRNILLACLLIKSALLGADTINKPSLTMLLKEVERMYKVTISYSPTFTNTVYPNVSQSVFAETDTAIDLLSAILKDTPFDVNTDRRIMFLYKKKPEVSLESSKVAPLMKPIAIKRDTTRIDSLRGDTVGINMDLTNGHIYKLKQPVFSQQIPYEALSVAKNDWNIYTNLLLLGTGSINVGVNYGLSSKWTIGTLLSYNPWQYGKTRLKHFLVSPGVRYWLCDNNAGHFLGANITYARYNVGGIGIPFVSHNIKNNRYQGDMGGVGISYGYSWIVGKHFNLEVELGLGVQHAAYSKYPCASCGDKIKDGRKTFIMPNKLGVNLVYMLK